MSGNEVTFNGKGSSPYVNHRQELAQIIRQKLRSSTSFGVASFPLAVRSENTTEMQTPEPDKFKLADKGFSELKARGSLPVKDEESPCMTHQFRVELERLHEKNNKFEETLRQKNNEIDRLNALVKDLQSKHLFNLQALEELRYELIQRDAKPKVPNGKDEKRAIERRHSSVCSTAIHSRYGTPKKVEGNTREMTGKYSGIFFIPEYRSPDDMGKQEQCMPFLSRSNYNWMASLRSEPPSPIKTRSKTVKETSMKPVALNFTAKFVNEESK